MSCGVVEIEVVVETRSRGERRPFISPPKPSSAVAGPIPSSYLGEVDGLRAALIGR